ncbi:homoserine O-acetyltransferase [Elysia marginata]|uniref:Homoserine O-acetyltransferase n=1 Tax=Elysia marginata TaxID=1093978 RepID=A0AAV4FQV0_9GAST|nr:homoserine O-acetyltransferase [Elysia marginata]
MTANSTICGAQGWWNRLVGEGKAIDTNTYNVIAFNIPGNGYDGFFIENREDFVPRDIADMFVLGLKSLGIDHIYASIGGSIGGILTWEIAVGYPEFVDVIIPIATDWKATDWILANTFVQELILKNSSEPLHDARVHAMNLYRTPQSYKEKFQRSIHEKKNMFNVESWLLHHGQHVEERFTLSAYKMVNQLVRTNDLTRARGTFEEVVKGVKAKILLVAIDSDMFFVPSENIDTFERLKSLGKNVDYREVKSQHGHDGFLIEFEQLEEILKPVFSYENKYFSEE